MRIWARTFAARRSATVFMLAASLLTLAAGARADQKPASAGQSPAAQDSASPPSIITNSPTTTNYDPGQGFPDRNGPFSAMLVVIPRSELNEFELPGGARHLDRVARAEPGAELAFKILFTGMTGDWNGYGNVTYDLQVLQPDGKVYGASDYRNLDALHGKVGSGKGVFDNRGKVVLMSFEPTDTPGPYTIKATIHDKVAARDIPLQAVIELLPPRPAPVAVPDAVATPQADAPVDTPAPAKKSKRHRRRHR